MVLLGLPLKFAEIERPLREHFRFTYRNIGQYATSYTLMIRHQPVRWRRRGYLRSWLRDVVSVDSGIEWKFSRSPANKSRSMASLRRLARDNATRGVVFDTQALWCWPDYHDEVSLQNQRQARAEFFGRGT